MRTLSWVLTATFLLLVLGCRGKNDDVASSDDDPPEKKAANSSTVDPATPADDSESKKSTQRNVERQPSDSALDLAYVTPDHFAAVFIRPAAIAASDVLKAVPDEMLFNDLFDEFGLKPAEVEQLVFLFGADVLDQAAQPSLVFRLNEGIDAGAKVDQLIGISEVTTKEQNGFSVRVNTRGGQAVTGKDGLIIACGSEESLMAMLDWKRTSSPLIDKLNQVEDSSRAVTIAFAVEPVTGIVDGLIDRYANALPPTVVPMVQAAKTIDSGLLYADLAGKNLLELQLEANDDSAGEELSNALQGGVAALKLFYPGLKSQMLAEAPFPIDESLTNIADQVVNSLTIERQAENVSISAANPGGLAEALAMAVQGAEEAQKAMRGVHHFQQLMLAFHNYHETYSQFPPAKNPAHFDENGQPHLSWRVHLLPFLGEIALFEQFNLEEPWDSETNAPLLDEMPAIFKTTSELTKTTIMGFVSQPNAPMRAGMAMMPNSGGPKIADFLDGTSQSGFIFEFSPEMAVPWTKPVDVPYEADKALPSMGKPDDDFVIVGFVDGSATRIPKDIGEDLWRAIITRNGYKSEEDVDFSIIDR